MLLFPVKKTTYFTNVVHVGPTEHNEVTQYLSLYYTVCNIDIFPRVGVHVCCSSFSEKEGFRLCYFDCNQTKMQLSDLFYSLYFNG